jgi:hypothetical protein
VRARPFRPLRVVGALPFFRSFRRGSGVADARVVVARAATRPVIIVAVVRRARAARASRTRARARG